MKSFRNIRVIPVVVVAIACLAVLKIAGLLIDGGYVFAYQPEQPDSAANQVERAKQAEQVKPASWAQENLNFPGAPKQDSDITGSVDKPKPKEPAPKPQEPKPQEPKPDVPKPAAPQTTPDGVVYHPDDSQPGVSPAERAILERLQSRRQELDERARELDIRENLLKTAEKRIESKVAEAKAVEAQITAAKAQKTEADNARFKNIVTMYQNMKPKDAAKVFDRLEMPVLIEIASQMSPRNMSEIMGLMQPETAERLTVELAHRANGTQTSTTAVAADLPKIEGKVLPQQSN
jgi:flagellar motility protein MotE (MotC chaperone)